MEHNILEKLNHDQLQLIKDAYAYITVLIAGADGKIEPKELEWAEKIVQIRTFSGEEGLFSLHEAITAELPGKIKSLIHDLPTDTSERSKILSENIAALNPILANLDPATGAYLYKGYISFAERVAKASGGFLSFFSIGPEEKKWMSLPMLTAIIYNPDEEE